MIEKSVEKIVVKQLNQDGYYYNNEQGNIYTKNGVPDLTCCVQGRYIGIETKAGNGHKLTVAQLFEGYKIVRCGGVYIVAYKDFNSFDEYLNDEGEKYTLSSAAKTVSGANELSLDDYALLEEMWLKINKEKKTVVLTGC